MLIVFDLLVDDEGTSLVKRAARRAARGARGVRDALSRGRGRGASVAGDDVRADGEAVVRVRRRRRSTA